MRNQEVTVAGGGGARGPSGVSKVPAGDWSMSPDGRGSDKPDDKLSPDEIDLRRVVVAWSRLPGSLKAGILAMVKACLGREEDT